MEYWDVYDCHRKLSGDIVERNDLLAENQYHLVVHVCIFNKSNEMLIQFRQHSKKERPGLWDISAGGAAISGEDSVQAAEREVFEETGIKISLAKETPYISINFDHGFDDYYIIKDSVDIQMLSPQQSEVLCFQWADKELVLSMLESRTFVPYHRSFLELIFAFNQLGRGTLIK